MTAPACTHPISAEALPLATRRILAPGVHTAPGFGVAIYASGVTRRDFAYSGPVCVRYFFTPYKSFPLLGDQFTLPALRSRGAGITVSAPDATPPQVIATQLRDTSGFVPIPWPEGSVGA